LVSIESSYVTSY